MRGIGIDTTIIGITIETKSSGIGTETGRDLAMLEGETGRETGREIASETANEIERAIWNQKHGSRKKKRKSGREKKRRGRKKEGEGMPRKRGSVP